MTEHFIIFHYVVEERSQNEIEGLKQQIAQQSTNIDKILKILTHKADLATENN